MFDFASVLQQQNSVWFKYDFKIQYDFRGGSSAAATSKMEHSSGSQRVYNFLQQNGRDVDYWRKFIFIWKKFTHDNRNMDDEIKLLKVP